MTKFLEVFKTKNVPEDGDFKDRLVTLAVRISYDLSYFIALGRIYTKINYLLNRIFLQIIINGFSKAVEEQDGKGEADDKLSLIHI